jgi:DNA-directed RNA polymerase
MDRLEGGTVLPITSFWLGGARSGHTTEQQGRPVSDTDLKATDLIAATGWRINKRLREAAMAAFTAEHPAIGVKAFSPPRIPSPLPKAEFAALSPEERRALCLERKAAREANEEWRSVSKATSSLLWEAGEDAAAPVLYCSHGHDARLRRYPRVSSGPSPQGCDLSRALLTFNEGVALGSRGIWWLAAKAATHAGLDKLPHQARAEWASEHTEDIRAAARDPLNIEWWWRDREEPWQLLATCMELDEALKSPSPGEFASRLPCFVDGTCNGLQHLSALGLDPVGAIATNLSADATRHDIYEEVAAVVRARVEADAASGLDVAQAWVGTAPAAILPSAPPEATRPMLRPVSAASPNAGNAAPSTSSVFGLSRPALAALAPACSPRP